MALDSATVLCMCLLFGATAAADGKGLWDQVRQKAHGIVSGATSDVATVSEILEHGHNMIAGICHGEQQAMQVDEVLFNRSDLSLRVRGYLTKEVAHGKVVINMSLGSPPPGATMTEKLRRTAAWMSVGHKHQEDLCTHLARSRGAISCPLAAGSQELRFAFNHLPAMVVAGKYKMHIRALDESDGRIACVTATLNIPRGKKGELFRRVSSSEYDDYSYHYDDNYAIVSAASQVSRSIALSSLGALAFQLVG